MSVLLRWRWLGLATSSAGVVFAALAQSPVLVGANSALATSWLTFIIIQWRKNHGSNRRAEAGPPDPDAGTIPPYFATGGAVSAGAAAGQDLSLEVVESEVPILAQRAARLVFYGNSHHWASIHKDATFGVDADARCSRLFLSYRLDTGYHTSPSPAVDCDCGFYAVPCDVEPWVEAGAYVSLLVELSGTVIEHERGYRAGHQRVVECRIPPCRYCGSPASVVDVREMVMASACCESHTPSAPDQVLVTLADLENLLPVPVTTAGRNAEATP